MEKWGSEPEHMKGILHTEIDGEIIKETYPSELSCYERYYQNIFESIRMHQPLLVKPEEALEAVKIIEIAEQSNREGKTIVVL